MEIEDAKADLTNAVKTIVSRAKESKKIQEEQHKEGEVEENKVTKDKDKENDEDQSSNESSSFYDEVFYDAQSESTFVAAEAAKLVSCCSAHSLGTRTEA